MSGLLLPLVFGHKLIFAQVISYSDSEQLCPCSEREVAYEIFWLYDVFLPALSYFLELHFRRGRTQAYSHVRSGFK